MRYLLLDRVLEMEAGRRVLGVKCVTKGEPFMCGLSSYPNPLVLESMFQCGGHLSRAGVNVDRSTVLGKVEHAKFVAEARPGDTIRIEVDIALSREEGNLCESVATVDGEEIGRARFLILYVPDDKRPAETPEARGRRMRLSQALGIVAREEA